MLRVECTADTDTVDIEKEKGREWQNTNLHELISWIRECAIVVHVMIGVDEDELM